MEETIVRYRYLTKTGPTRWAYDEDTIDGRRAQLEQVLRTDEGAYYTGAEIQQLNTVSSITRLSVAKVVSVSATEERVP